MRRPASLALLAALALAAAAAGELLPPSAVRVTVAPSASVRPAAAAAAAAASTPESTCFGWFCRPQQLHLAHGQQADSGASSVMVATWSTYNETAQYVQYGEASAGRLTEVVNASSTYFLNRGGAGAHFQYVFRATMAPLKPGVHYAYRVGNDVAGWSTVYTFRAQRTEIPSDAPLRLAVYGDLGDANSQSLAAVQTLAMENSIDAIYHIGDYAYDLNSEDGLVGDRFMRDIEPLAATVGYMGGVGNHEADIVVVSGVPQATFENYVNRFSFPGDSNGMWYSWDIGSVHVVTISSEVYFWGSQRHLIPKQFAWLQADLAEANKNRDKRPWIVTFTHRPMYCSNSDGDDCSQHYSVLRDGLNVNGTLMYGLEDVLYNAGVDLSFWAHEHDYERIVSGLYRNETLPTKFPPYVNPPATTQLIAGSAGCREIHDPFSKTPPPLSAFRSQDYGYGILEFANDTVLHWQQFNQSSHLLDSITLVREKHVPYGAAKPRRADPAVDEMARPRVLDG